YTHSHSDHFGGAGGLVSAEDAAAGKVKVVAPEGFMEAVASENILAGPAMQRRAVYQFGVFLPRGPEGQVGAGIGPGLSRGTPARARPTPRTPRRRPKLPADGVGWESRRPPGPGGRAGMTTYLPSLRALCRARTPTPPCTTS